MNHTSLWYIGSWKLVNNSAVLFFVPFATHLRKHVSEKPNHGYSFHSQFPIWYGGWTHYQVIPHMNINNDRMRSKKAIFCARYGHLQPLFFNIFESCILHYPPNLISHDILNFFPKKIPPKRCKVPRNKMFHFKIKIWF